jgi:hypothetical protein
MTLNAVKPLAYVVMIDLAPNPELSLQTFLLLTQ